MKLMGFLAKWIRHSSPSSRWIRWVWTNAVVVMMLGTFSRGGNEIFLEMTVRKNLDLGAK